MTSVLNMFSRWFLHHDSFAGYIEPIMQLVKPAWRAGYFRAQVMQIHSLAHGYINLELAPEKKWPGFSAGQHISLTSEINGRLLTRVFSIASGVDEYKQTGRIRLLIKSQQNTRFTAKLTQVLQQGDWCNISSASGEFVYQPSNKPVVFVAGGSGITPILAMLKTHLAQRTAATSLLYYAKPGMHQVVTELNTLAQQFHHFSLQLLTRAEQPDVLAQLNVDNQTQIYCCGPNSLMAAIKAFAQDQQLNYYQEQFGLQLAPSGDKNATVLRMQIGSKVHRINNSEPLLNQFEQQNLNAKRGCGIGICHQCQCVKKVGVVRNLKTGELSDNGEQLIQLCISQAVSDLEIQA